MGLISFAEVPISKEAPNLEYFREDKIYPVALRGTLRPVLEEFGQTQNSDLSLEQLKLKNKYLKRFVDIEDSRLQSNNPLAQDVLNAYQTYWKDVLTEKLSVENGYLDWFDRLNNIAKEYEKDFSPFSEDNAEALAEFLTLKLKEEGFFAQIGRTIPHMDLLLWRSQETKVYSINLGDRLVEVPVVLMDNFETFGWLGYATFDYKYTGGWATQDSLFCVVPAYDLNSEKFNVSYLAHEARHFSDYKRFPDLKSHELEYRAKLTELSLAKSSLKKLLLHFLSEADDNPSSPHAYASYLVIDALKGILGKSVTPNWIELVDIAQINQTARNLIEKSDLSLAKRFSSP